MKERMPVALAITAASRDETTSDLIRSLPCVEALGARRPDMRRIKGVLAVALEGGRDGFGVTGIEPYSPDVDAELANCLRHSLLWSTRWFGPKATGATWKTKAQWDFVFSLPPRNLPRLVSPWTSPESWQKVVDGQSAGPAGWERYVADVREAGDAAQMHARATAQSSAEAPALSFHEFLGTAPVLGTMLYARIATRDAYERVAGSACARALLAELPPRGNEVRGTLHVTFRVSQEIAEIVDFRDAAGAARQPFVNCIRKLGDWPTEPLRTLGEKDGIYHLAWGYGYSRSREAVKGIP